LAEDEEVETAAEDGGERRKVRWAESCVENARWEFDERAVAVRRSGGGGVQETKD